ncbi:MAG: hypothetical protein HYZ44_13295 [Bacteroidetes bacterium]|nr:hypothetical protein [Bacteroidota bacterium]
MAMLLVVIGTQETTASATTVFGYNGMEKDPETKGDGNSYTTEFRQYDPRLGRWASLDPLMKQFPWMSPYVGFDNNPIYYTDPYGLSSSTKDGDKKGKDGGKSGSLEKGADKLGNVADDLKITKRKDGSYQIGNMVINPKRDKHADSSPKKSANSSPNKSKGKSSISATVAIVATFLNALYPNLGNYDENWTQGSHKFNHYGNSTGGPLKPKSGIDVRVGGDDEYSYDDWKPFSAVDVVVEFFPILPGNLTGNETSGGGVGQKLKYKQKLGNKATDLKEIVESGSDTPLTRASDLIDAGNEALKNYQSKPTFEDINIHVLILTNTSSDSFHDGPLSYDQMKTKYSNAQWDSDAGEWKAITDTRTK